MYQTIAALAFSILAISNPVQAQNRVALVIGNSSYEHIGTLANPRNDAADVAAALKKHRFKVLEGFDLDKQAFDEKLREFSAALKDAQAGVFYFAGHGLQVNGENYLVSVDAGLPDPSALDFEAVQLGFIQRIMEREAQTSILFLDACRDSPRFRNLSSSNTRSLRVGRGLASVESGVGTLISFSTQPGNVSLDGQGRNSPYARALAKYISVSRDDLSTILIDVRNDVMQETSNTQVPWEHSALRGRFYFGSGDPAIKTVLIPTLPKLDGGTSGPFDGQWVLTAVAASGCAMQRWSNVLTIRQGAIFVGDTRSGKVEANGAFTYARPNRNFPQLKVAISGRLTSASGKGSFTTGNCVGTVSVARQ